MTKEFIHYPLNEEVRFISGYYQFAEEVRMVFGEDVLLVLLGHGVVDTACCGTTGCAYALIAGIVEDWKFRQNTDGLPVSRVAPVASEESRKEIEALLKKDHLVQQVVFYEG